MSGSSEGGSANQVPGFLQKAVKAIHIVEETAIVSVLMTMIVLAVLQIVLRNFFEMSVLWIDPLLRNGVLWIGLLGSLIATRANDHIAIDLVSHYVPANLRRFLLAFISLFTVTVCGLVAYYSYQFVLWDYEAPTYTVGQIPNWALQSIIPIAFAGIALRYFILAILALINRLPEDIEGVDESHYDGEV